MHAVAAAQQQPDHHRSRSDDKRTYRLKRTARRVTRRREHPPQRHGSLCRAGHWRTPHNPAVLRPVPCLKRFAPLPDQTSLGACHSPDPCHYIATNAVLLPCSRTQSIAFALCACTWELVQGPVEYHSFADLHVQPLQAVAKIDTLADSRDGLSSQDLIAPGREPFFGLCAASASHGYTLSC